MPACGYVDMPTYEQNASFVLRVATLRMFCGWHHA